MKLRWAALVAVLAISAFTPRSSAAQSSGANDQGSGAELGQNSPNPFTQDTKIPFTLGDYPVCSDPNRVYRVNLRIFNILSQVIATPVLQGGSGSAPDGTPLQNVELACGQYIAYWDGKNAKSGASAAPGIYLYRLEVDKRPVAKKMTKSR